MSSRFEHSVQIVSAQPGRGQDRARVIERGGELVIALADGAGGTGGGAEAAQAIVDAAGGHNGDWAELLLDLDADSPRLHGGQSTAVLLTVSACGIIGASVGDSSAWLVGPDGAHDLTAAQSRKPLVGAGCSPAYVPPIPIARATLLVASDGLFHYARRPDIVRCVTSSEPLDAIAGALVALVRLPNGQLQDDVAIILCRQVSAG